MCHGDLLWKSHVKSQTVFEPSNGSRFSRYHDMMILPLFIVTNHSDHPKSSLIAILKSYNGI